jgi:hypothetical protein
VSAQRPNHGLIRLAERALAEIEAPGFGERLTPEQGEQLRAALAGAAAARSEFELRRRVSGLLRQLADEFPLGAAMTPSFERLAAAVADRRRTEGA